MKKYMRSILGIFCVIVFAMTGCADNTQGSNGVFAEQPLLEGNIISAEEENAEMYIEEENGDMVDLTPSEGFLESGVRYVFSGTFSDAFGFSFYDYGLGAH